MLTVMTLALGGSVPKTSSFSTLVVNQRVGAGVVLGVGGSHVRMILDSKLGLNRHEGWCINEPTRV